MLCLYRLARINWLVDVAKQGYTCFLRQLLFYGSKLTEGDRCGQKDCSENIIVASKRELDVDCTIFILPLCFRRDNNQGRKKDSLLLETLVARDIRR